MAMVTSSNPMNNTSCSSASMIDSFCQTPPTIWDHHPTNPQMLGAFSDLNMQNNPTTSSSSLGFRKGNLLAPSWPPPNSAIKRGGMFLAPPTATSSLSPYNNRPVQGQPQEGFVNGFKSTSGEGSKDIPLPTVKGGSAFSGSQPKNDARQGGFAFSGADFEGVKYAIERILKLVQNNEFTCSWPTTEVPTYE
ncbi:hypothetical protein L2E82_11517 [Cichorium intybus]|uniref:Uncharacterized protein n=1 Tax=Cichorium intybus TaxID=13427 RepID=A0ACB9GEI6_CICIN|nr:hypothetical protein L2E82_11517 [Cichorium intybus]